MPRPKLILALESKLSILIGLWRFNRRDFQEKESFPHE